jgi:hypothetical protein
MNRGDYGGWLMISGEEPTGSTLKMFDPDNSFVTFNYMPLAPSVVTPIANQVLSTRSRASQRAR